METPLVPASSLPAKKKIEIQKLNGEGSPFTSLKGRALKHLGAFLKEKI
jgi:hypothetical protein